MPELPEVETIRRGLLKAMKGQCVSKIIVRRTDLRRPVPRNFIDMVSGKRILNVNRRAKYLLVILESNVVVIVHLGMSGRMVIERGTDPNIPSRKHEHIVFILEGDINVRFSDPRRFGLIEISNFKNLSSHDLLKNIGIEPLSKEFNALMLVEQFKKRKRTIKSVLLDQSIVAGLGNIYVCEGLFMAKISPTRITHSLTFKEIEIFVIKIKQLLLDAIRSGGSTLKDHVSATGNMGYFQYKFLVYGREDKPCMICGEAITRINQAGRSTFFCNNCQK
tara:strand:+ start:991 stop:1821 length:831 start_codon:yes stop_codon:yes gene_type:complete